MKIIYLTTSLEENDYIEFNKMWKVSLNPSNQNFHNKIIRALAIYNDTEVISIRPFSSRNCTLPFLKADTKKVGNITYNYLAINKRHLLRMWKIKKQIKKILDKIDLKETIIITDTINPKCVSMTSFIKKKYKLPSIGICTDSPSNITGTRKSYTLYLLRLCQRLDGFITLTEGLNMLFNPNNKEHITIEGIIETQNKIEPSPRKDKYIFFGGALLPRYGVFNLIEAFKKIENKDIKLLICGHHANEEEIYKAIKNDERIEYLGTLTVKEVLSLESNALININPRPFTQDLDRLSIPSKTLEYLSSGSLTISVRNTELEKHFASSALWAKSGEVNDLYESIKEGLSMSDEERKEIANQAKNTAISLYSLEKIGQIIGAFLLQFIK